MTLSTQISDQPAWSAVWSMSLGIFGIVAAEFLPASLLTPMASDLHVSEGAIGQAVTVTAGVAVLASICVAAASGRIDRKKVLLTLTFLLVLSNLLVAIAPKLTTVLLGRILLGVSLGGFWALSAATMMRLVPEAHVPKALAILFGGVTAATVFAAPAGSFFGDLYGWRTVFTCAAGLGACAFVAQLLFLPVMTSERAARIFTLFSLLGRRRVGFGMTAFLLVFAGHFGFFTYLRPFLEDVGGLGASGVTLVLLIFGFGTFLGNSVSSFLIGRSLPAVLVSMPLLLGVLALLLASFGEVTVLDAALVGLWGIAFGIIPVSWSTWVTQIVPDEAESGGGLLVATANLAIMIGAGLGGIVFDVYGVEALFVACGAVLVLGAVAAGKVRPV
ncbi:MFS transporter [Tritonibacter mobilis]|nr:MFS transporter [Tritonibacter mobilis]